MKLLLIVTGLFKSSHSASAEMKSEFQSAKFKIHSLQNERKKCIFSFPALHNRASSLLRARLPTLLNTFATTDIQLILLYFPPLLREIPFLQPGGTPLLTHTSHKISCSRPTTVAISALSNSTVMAARQGVSLRSCWR